MTQVQQRREMPSEAEIGRYRRALCEVLAGRPREFMEGYLWLRLNTGKLVRMKFTPNQEYYYGEIFEGLDGEYRHEIGKVVPDGRGMNRPVKALLLKDRKAEWSTFIKAVTFTYIFCVPGVEVVSAADSVDNAENLLRMYDTFWNGLPWWMKEPDRRKHWDATFREFSHLGPDMQEVQTSAITIASSRSRTFGRGATPKIIDLDEAGRYDPTFERELYQSIEDSRPPNAWEFKAGTPEGQGKRFFRDFQAAKQGNGKYLRRYVFQNPSNRYEVGNPFSRLEDREIVVGRGGQIGDDSEEWFLERVRESHPGIEEERALEFLRFRRGKIAEAVARQNGDPDRGWSDYQQEHAEDDVQCWMGDQNTAIKPSIKTAMREGKEQPKEVDKSNPAFPLKVWRYRAVGATYVGIVDSASEDGRDFTAFHVYDVASGILVAHAYGKSSPAPTFELAVKTMRRYGDGMICPLSTGTQNYPRDMLRTLGYGDKIWRRRKRLTETLDSAEYIKRPWGLVESATIQQDMQSMFVTQIEEGRLWTFDEDVMLAWFGYTPGVDRHKPDHLACAHAFAYIRATLPQGTAAGTASAQEEQAPVRVVYPANIPSLRMGGRW